MACLPLELQGFGSTIDGGSLRATSVFSDAPTPQQPSQPPPPQQQQQQQPSASTGQPAATLPSQAPTPFATPSSSQHLRSSLSLGEPPQSTAASSGGAGAGAPGDRHTALAQALQQLQGATEKGANRCLSLAALKMASPVGGGQTGCWRQGMLHRCGAAAL